MFQPTIGSMYYGAVPFYVLSGASFVAAAICFSLLFLLWDRILHAAHAD